MSSEKEKEILERQRILAASLKPKQPPNTKTSSSSALPVQQPKPASAAAPPAKKPAPPPPRKKPSRKQSSSAILALAQQHKPDGKPSPKLERKATSTTNNNKSTLSQIIQQAETKNNEKSDMSQSLANYNPDDFWKNLRNWDVPVDYFQQQQQKAANDTTLRKKPIPDTFLNSRHYVAAWAPLCLAECRAQLLQELTQRMTAPIFVDVEVTASRRRNQVPWVTEGEDTETYVMVNPKQRTGGNLSFMTNDLVLLVQTHQKDIMSHISKGAMADEESCSGLALVGHTESTRRELKGLILKVSKRKWATIGKKEMYLMKIGSNVTALREFTALCSVETLPMKQFLLGQHLEKADNRRKLSRNQPVDQLLHQMGGEQLGSGFLQYAGRKFNQSQLTAIAASAHEYGDGGFTLIKGPPGTGKTTTLVAVLNSLHIRQYNKFYDEVRRIATKLTGSRESALASARRSKPRLLVCAPSNAAIDNIILKIMEDGFVDGKGQRYNPRMIRVGVGQSLAVQDVSLSNKVAQIFADQSDPQQIEASIDGYKVELSRCTGEITKCRQRLAAISSACPWPLSSDWEIRIDESCFETHGKAYFVNHKTKQTTYEQPPPPEPGEKHFKSTSMPHYQELVGRVVKLVENYYAIKSHLERCVILKRSFAAGTNEMTVRLDLEEHLLDSAHLVMTTLGSAGSRSLENSERFEVIVVDEAAQSVEMAALSALRLGSKHVVLVGDPQQLPATIFNVSGRNSKYDRSLFQRLEEAGQPVYMLNEQYRMHPKISHFPRNIFYQGALLDGPNVKDPNYGNPLISSVRRHLPAFSPFTILDLDSKESRSGGTSLSNISEAKLAVYLVDQLNVISGGLSSVGRIAIITPYTEQCKLLSRSFENALGPRYESSVEINTVDGFQGREANIVIFSAVRAAGSHGIGFLADVRRMNVAMTRAKHFLFMIARCKSVVVNPYWSDLVNHARETRAVLKVPMVGKGASSSFGPPASWKLDGLSPQAQSKAGPFAKEQSKPPNGIGTRLDERNAPEKNGEGSSKMPSDPRKKSVDRKKDSSFTKPPSKPQDPRKRGYNTASAPTVVNPSNGGVTKPVDPRKRRK